MFTMNVALWICFTSHVTCPHSEHTGWVRWCRPMLSARRESACTGRVQRNCWQRASPSPGAAQQHTHILSNKHTYLQVSVTAGGVLSMALWDIFVTVIIATLSLPTQKPNTHPHCSHSRFLQLQVRLLKLETTYPLLGVQLSEPYLVDMNWNVNCDVYQVSQGKTGYQSIGSIPHAFILVDNPEQGGISNDPHS